MSSSPLLCQRHPCSLSPCNVIVTIALSASPLLIFPVLCHHHHVLLLSPFASLSPVLSSSPLLSSPLLIVPCPVIVTTALLASPFASLTPVLLSSSLLSSPLLIFLCPIVVTLSCYRHHCSVSVTPARCSSALSHPPAMSSSLLWYRPMLCHSVPLCHRHSFSVIVPLLCQRHFYSVIVTLFIVHLLCHRHLSSVIVTPALSSSPYSSPPCSLVITVLSSSPCSAVSPLHTLCTLIVATALPSPAALLCHSDLSSLLLCHRPPALSPPPCSVIVVCSVIITPD